MTHYGSHSAQAEKGFTLIELLVVIAIIGVLSAVVLASLSTARSKGNDAAIQANLSTIQVQAEVYYGTTGVNSYGNASATGSCSSPAGGSLFADGSTISKALSSAGSAAGGIANLKCNNSSSAYAVSAPLSTGTTWCIDSTGYAGVRAGGALSAGTTNC